MDLQAGGLLPLRPTTCPSAPAPGWGTGVLQLSRAAPLRRKTLQLSRQLKEQAVEAQACYSLGNTYTLLQDHERAAEYHLRHLLIAQELADRCAGQTRPGAPTGPAGHGASRL